VAQTGIARARRDISGPRLPKTGRDCGSDPRYAAVGENAAACSAVSCTKSKPSVVRDVEPFVPIDRDRMRSLDSLDEMPALRRQRGEQAAGGVGVQARAVALGELTQLGDGVEVSAVDVACGRDQDG